MGKTEHPLKIAFYSPYIEMMGGGERYILTIAKALSHKYNVYLYASSELLDKAKEKFNLNLDRVHFISNGLFRTYNLLKKTKELLRYDILFYMTDGSLFFSPTKKNFLIIQSSAHLPPRNIINRLKFINWQLLCYSSFMQNIIKHKLGMKALVLSPCVEIKNFKASLSQKENVILSVGRFFKKPHDKKQDFLVDFFKKNYKKSFPGWKLVIAGGLTEKSGSEILKVIKVKAKGFPIEIIVNLSFPKLHELYKKAKIYWHAAGFGENLVKFPERAEHFGITTLESMTAGCIPVVFGGGGQLDIIKDGINGYLWKSERELLDKSESLINDSKLMHKMSEKVVKGVEKFSCHKFNEQIEKIISS